jgi:NAD(P)-dependent dehydrogenase (short-subunit alcohol dehydrogenase family)
MSAEQYENLVIGSGVAGKLLGWTLAGKSQKTAQTPLGRISHPQDVAPVVVFLACADSAFITGENLYVSGGLR